MRVTGGDCAFAAVANKTLANIVPAALKIAFEAGVKFGLPVKDFMITESPPAALSQPDPRISKFKTQWKQVTPNSFNIYSKASWKLNGLRRGGQTAVRFRPVAS